MSKEFSKKNFHEKCNACDFQKLKQLETNPAVRKLRDKIEQLNSRLTECRNENQMLKRNLQLAKKMVYQEVGGNDIDFQSLMKYGTEHGWKGRQENLLLLKNKVQELKNHLRELEGDQPTPHETPSEHFVKYQMPSDRKKLWRMELERRLAREDAEKDINPLVQECVELRRNLDSAKTRFRELSNEVKLLRAELQSQVEKNEDDVGIVNSFKTLENQLQEAVSERALIRKELEGSRSRNKRLTEEIESMKDELQVLQKKTSDSNTLIESLNSAHKSIQEAIDAAKLIVQQNVERYKEELKGLQENHAIDTEILDHVQCIIFDRNDLIDEMKKGIEEDSMVNDEGKKNVKCLKNANIDKTPSKQFETTQQSELNSKEETNSAAENIPGESDEESNIRKLRHECAKYEVLTKAAKMENEGLSCIVARQESKMNKLAIQVVETGRLIMLKNAEKKELLERINQLQRSMSAKRRKGKVHLKGKLEDLRIKCDAKKFENDFLRNFLRSAVCAKAKDMQLFKAFNTDIKRFFEKSLMDFKESLKAEQSNQENILPSETTNEQNSPISS